MSTTPDLFPGPRISRVTIGRLHNLGNYEHVRFEVTVELPAGTSPASVIGELERTLDELDPKPPVDYWTLDRARMVLSEPPVTASTRGDDDPPFGESDMQRQARRKAEAAETIAKYQQWRELHDQALARFNQFGGASAHTDAKRDWDDE